jgi:hypothetical protein
VITASLFGTHGTHHTLLRNVFGCAMPWIKFDSHISHRSLQDVVFRESSSHSMSHIICLNLNTIASCQTCNLMPTMVMAAADSGLDSWSKIMHVPHRYTIKCRTPVDERQHISFQLKIDQSEAYVSCKLQFNVHSKSQGAKTVGWVWHEILISPQQKH